MNRELINREISWLSFNARVLQEASDPSVPLLERLGFLSIFSSNLDEFFRVRVAHWRRLARLKKKKAKALGLQPKEVLRQIHAEVHRQQERFGHVFRNEVLPELRDHGVRLVREASTEAQRDFLERYFDRDVRPLVDPELVHEDDQPFLEDRGLYLVVAFGGNAMFAPALPGEPYGLVRIPSPPLARFLELPTDGQGHDVMFLDDVVRSGLPRLFPQHPIDRSYSVKLSRDADLRLEDEFDGDIVEAIRKSLAKRRTGVPSRFLYDMRTPYALVTRMRERFGLEPEDLVVGGRYHNLHDLRDFPACGLEDEFAYEPWDPLPHPELEGADSVLALVAEQDRVLHFPYQSYRPVVAFLEEAAEDPEVDQIWLTVYRVSRESPILRALLRAAERGKSVRVFVEVQARFDEAANIEWADRLERAGVVTLFPSPGLKVHAKIALVVRSRPSGPERFAYLGTGNFNERTARIYADHALLTADERITLEVERVFRFLSGEVERPRFEHLLVAPFNLRSGCYELLDAERAAARRGEASGVVAKMNSLEDPAMIGKLYETASAGVPIDLIVRGICCLKPGVEGLSESIRARSIVDRYLEHARVWNFHNGGEPCMYLASADWMERNLNRRVEVAVPIYDPAVRAQLDAILALQLADNRKARWIDAEQRNAYAEEGANPVRSQEATRELLAERVRARA